MTKYGKTCLKSLLIEESEERTSESPSASSGIKIPSDLDLGGSRAKERSKSMKRFLTCLEGS